MFPWANLKQQDRHTHSQTNFTTYITWMSCDQVFRSVQNGGGGGGGGGGSGGVGDGGDKDRKK